MNNSRVGDNTMSEQVEKLKELTAIQDKLIKNQTKQIKRWDTREVIFALACNSLTDLIKGAINAKISFYRADLSSANLRNANLSSANLRSANLRSADLRSANLRFADLRNANLSSANLRSANLRSANLRYADLRNANLSSANLSSANLRYVNLRYAIGDMREIQSMQIDKYLITFTKEILSIGCEKHTHKEWIMFTDKQISRMDTDALAWWNKWKEFVFMAIELKYGKEVSA